MFDRCVDALTAPMDRAEMTAVIDAERFRQTIAQEAEELAFTPDTRDACDQPRFDGTKFEGDDRVPFGEWAALSAVRPAFGRVLYRVARATGGPIVECGTGTGTSTAYLSLAIRDQGDGEIWTIEPHPVLAQISERHLSQAGFDRTHVIRASQESVFPS